MSCKRATASQTSLFSPRNWAKCFIESATAWQCFRRLSDWTQSCRTSCALEASVSLIVVSLMDGNAVAVFYFRGKSHHIPIRKADAAVADSVANRIGLVGAVNANAFLVERDPHYTHRIPGTGREQIKTAAALAVLKHFFVVTKSRQLGDTAHLPLADR